MGQCSSSVRQWMRHSPPTSDQYAHSHDAIIDSNEPSAVSLDNIPSLRRRRSTEGASHQFKRQRPHDELTPQDNSQPDTRLDQTPTATLEPTDDVSQVEVVPSSSGTPFTASHATLEHPPSSHRSIGSELAHNSQEDDSVSSVSGSEGSGAAEAMRRSRTLRRLRDSLTSPFVRRPSGVSSATTTSTATTSATTSPLFTPIGAEINDTEGSESASTTTENLRSQDRNDVAASGELPIDEPRAVPNHAASGPESLPAEVSNLPSPSSPSAPESPDDGEFFDASNHISPPAYDRMRSTSRPADYPPPLPRARPPPPPFPMMPPWANQSRNRRDDENEQVTILSRVLLAAATLTATHLVGEHISSGELYGGSNEINRMRQRAQTEMDTLLDEARSADSAPSTDNDAQAPAQEQGRETQGQGASEVNQDSGAHQGADVQRENVESSSSSEGRESAEDSASQQNGSESETPRPMLSFPEFLEQLRTGRHTPELSRVMFDNTQVSNFFRFFRFPEDHEGRVPILLMGIRSAESARRADDEGGNANSDEGRQRPPPTGLRPFAPASENTSDANSRRRDSLGSQGTDEVNNWNVLDPQLFNDPFGLRTSAGSEDNESDDDIFEEIPEDEQVPITDDHFPGHNTETADDDQLFFDDNEGFVPESNPSDLFMGAMLDGLVSGPFSRTGRENRQFNRAHLNDEDDDMDMFSGDSRPFVPRPRHPATPAEPNNDDDQAQGTERRRSHQSWVIYVIGGAYPPTHPIFFAPSLLTDNPTYEDMLIFEQLLGPVKPSVASKNDVAAAGGQFTVAADSKLLSERCPICLMDYVQDDICRELSCKHTFHQECVDSWLTKSHNSCPMCRHEGVPSSSRPSQSNMRPGFGMA